MDKNMTVFQDNNLMVFHILPEWENHDSDLQGIVESLVRVTNIDYPNLDYTVLPSDGGMSYLIIHKHGRWNSYSYGEL